MPIGNDVVDLRDLEARPDRIHARFDRRVFATPERAVIEHPPSGTVSERVRWALWSAKESAFKAARQIDAGVRFVPRSFRVDYRSRRSADVTHDVAGLFRAWFNETKDWIHAVAVPLGPADLRAGVAEAPPGVARLVLGHGSGGHGVEELDAPDAPPRSLSERVRAAACESLASALAIELPRLGIVMRDGIPRVALDDHVLPIDLSLSHHGGVVAWAWRAG